MAGRMDIITTIEARCRDCYKCLRSCPVKAIKVERGLLGGELHARVDTDLCILDGKCVLVCPQKAKKVTASVERVRAMFDRGEKVAASIAPSFVAAFPDVDPLKIPAALRRLGFSYIQETALGAELVGRLHAKLFSESRATMISSSCPAIVNLIERHYPRALKFLAPVVSPMVAHGRYIKRGFPDMRVVFIGPCIAKLEEQAVPGIEDAIDEVITFAELSEWFSREGIDPSSLPAEGFDGLSPGYARFFPLAGGMLRTSELSTDMLSEDVISVCGVEACREFIEYILEGKERLPRLVEMLACEGGCIGGPMNPNGEDIYTKRRRVLEYVRRQQEHAVRGRGEVSESSEDESSPHSGDATPFLPQELLLRRYQDRTKAFREPTEEDIRAILARTGKFTPADELNCGACGYGSCREKALAVFRGMADPEMCLPYMRQRAESMANLFVASTPNGVIIVDSDEKVVDINAAALRMFRKQRHEVIGRKISRLMDPANFRKVLTEKSLLRKDATYPELGLTLRETIFYEEQQRLAMGIFVNITEDIKREEELRNLREQTLTRTQEVINKQMEVAQKIASLLGETTAETKVLLTKLMKLMREGDPGGGETR